MRYGLETVEPPAIEPLTIEEAAEHLRVETCDESATLVSLIQAAREQAELFTGRQIIAATYKLHLDRFPGAVDAIDVPRPPLIEVESIEYIDHSGSVQTLEESAYKVDAASEPGRIVPAYGERWPDTRDEVNAVTVQFKAGYGDDQHDVPERFKQAMKLMLGNWYQNRENVVIGTITAEVPQSAQALLWGLRIMEAV